jgi:hypothetical protein
VVVTGGGLHAVVVPLAVFDIRLPADVPIATCMLTVWPQLKPVQLND